jgi:tetratricopeptide (TPR) repeat protein
MKKTFFLLAIFCSCLASAQYALTVGNLGNNKRASVTEYIGLAKITIDYHRPGVKAREGKIWGTPVAHYGLQDLGFGTSTASPWRGGANENTTISFSHPVKVEGQPIAAGIYGLHFILGENEDVVVFSNRSNAWGSFYYDPAEDALRVTVKHQTMDNPVEWLKYEFTDQTEDAATVALMWEHRLIPFRIQADVHQMQMDSFRSELRTKPGFTWQAFVQAANYAMQYDGDMQQALEWADMAINARFVGQKNFRTLSTKAAVLQKLKRDKEADALMAEALPLGQIFELHQYGRQLIAEKKPAKALEAFQANYKKNPNVFTTNVGLGRGYSATGDYKKALAYMKAALKQAPDEANRASVENMIAQLSQRRDVNAAQ